MNAATVASTPKWPVRQRMSGGKRLTSAAIAGDAVTTAAHLRPARLNALLADTTLTATSAAPGTVSIGVNVAPGSTSGAWISSLTMVTPYRRASRTRAASSSRVCTRPTGLCGLQST